MQNKSPQARGRTTSIEALTTGLKAKISYPIRHLISGSYNHGKSKGLATREQPDLKYPKEGHHPP